MKRIALIRNGIVENIAAVADGDTFNPPGYQYVIDVTNMMVDIGYLYNGTVFTAPPLPPYMSDDITVTLPNNIMTYTASVFNENILVDATNGNIEITPVVPINGKLSVKKIDSSTNTVNIKYIVDGIQDYTIARQNGGCTLVFSSDQSYIVNEV